jgi:hypothetical protein
MLVIKQKAYYDQEAQDFLSKVSGKLDSETIRRINNGEVKLEEVAHYVRKRIDGQGGTNELINNTTVEKNGTVSFDKARLHEGEHLVLKGLRLGWTKTAKPAGTDPGGATDPALVVYSPKKDATMPPALRGANVIISQDNKVIFKRSVEDILADQLKDGGSEENAYQLRTWKTILAGRSFSIAIEYADGQAVPTDAHHFLEVRMYGSKTVLK